MVYSNKFIVCVLVNGIPSEERANGTVILPFGTEYVLRFRNKHNRRAVVNFSIDGENVSGKGYVVPANGFVDIKRHADVDRAFKFVSLDSADAIDQGKNGPNPDKIKGTIEASFYLEKEQIVDVQQVTHHHQHHHDYRRRTYRDPIYPPPQFPFMGGSGDGGNVSYGGGDINCSLPKSSSNFDGDSLPDTMNFLRSSGPPVSDGATVEGHSTGQTFRTVQIDLEDTATVLKIFLQGFEGEVEVPASQVCQKPAVSNVEAENILLRERLAEAENKRLKEQLAELESK